MRNVSIRIANVDTRVDQTVDGFFVSSSSDSVGGEIDSGCPFEEIWDKRIREMADGVIIGLRGAADRLFEVKAFRSPTSSYELYFLETSSDDLLITDQFSCAVASIPRQDRRRTSSSIADQLLFRTVTGKETFVEGIERVGQGEEVVWLGQELRGRRHQRRQLRAGSNAGMNDLEMIDTLLTGAISAFSELPNLQNMLSGGVDSTLTQTYIGDSVPSVSVRIDSGEFQHESEYALRAKELLGCPLAFVEVKERDYLRNLEAFVDSAALPPHHLQSVLYHSIFSSGGRRFVTSQFADALFGLGKAGTAERAWRLRRYWQPIPGKRLGQRVARVTGAARVEAVLRAGDQLLRHTADIRGLGMSFAMYTDLPFAVRILGEEMVRERMEARLDYVEACFRGNLRKPGTLAAHLELGHLLDYFNDDAISIWRQSAQSQGKALYAPFSNEHLASGALAIDPRDRYVRNGRVKHILKDLLLQRLSSYPTGQRKGSSGLPLTRYFSDGPLKDAFQQYDFPEYVDSKLRKPIIKTPSPLIWNLLTDSIWQARVLREDSIRMPSSLKEYNCKFKYE